ncbi:hypothetical protein, partial [Mesorhizobium sp. A556]
LKSWPSSWAHFSKQLELRQLSAEADQKQTDGFPPKLSPSKGPLPTAIVERLLPTSSLSILGH